MRQQPPANAAIPPPRINTPPPEPVAAPEQKP
jgi:hypothetical protein